ncbi:MAG: hypothetical protein QS748_07370 [Candidatus Endonucleobacter bathymodioli]|uniref:Uncharacterized protein n=1 Tax=Candidatus Endonucleibacter bathymodioli TaxID=539814 RepID=A0AA90NVK5_9GAMM|nr:hypothetical protein [Candidatus Endonucleobacter bathymodioli]
MLNIKLYKVLVALGMVFFTTIIISSVMAGGDDDYCQCNLGKSDGNARNHIYFCPHSDIYDAESCLDGEVQLSGFLEQLTEDLGKADLYKAMERNEKIAIPDQAAIIALHTDIKESMRGDLCMSICSKNIFMRDVNSIRQKVMEKISVLDIELCPLSMQEISEILYFIRCVVSPFNTDGESIIDDTENKILMVSCRYALSRWCLIYGENAPKTKEERVIFHSIVVAFCLVAYIEQREYYVENNVNRTDPTSELSNQYNYFLSIMQSLKDRYSGSVLDAKYRSAENVNMMLSFIEVDDYYEDNLDELRRMVFGNSSGFVLQSRSRCRRILLDFIVIKSGGSTKIKTLITPGLYWLTSSILSFESDIKVLLSSIPESSRFSDRIISIFEAVIDLGIGTIAFMRGAFLDFEALQ